MSFHAGGSTAQQRGKPPWQSMPLIAVVCKPRWIVRSRRVADTGTRACGIGDVRVRISPRPIWLLVEYVAVQLPQGRCYLRDFPGCQMHLNDDAVPSRFQLHHLPRFPIALHLSAPRSGRRFRLRIQTPAVDQIPSALNPRAWPLQQQGILASTTRERSPPCSRLHGAPAGRAPGL